MKDRDGKTRPAPIWFLLALAGGIGLLLAVGLALLALYSLLGLPLLASVIVYVVSVAMMTLVTGGARIDPWLAWLLRLGLPLAGAALVWILLASAGFGHPAVS